MKNFHKPLFATTVIITSFAFTTLAFAHSTSRHSSRSGQGYVVNHNQTDQQRNITPSRMQHRRDYRLRNRAMGNHQRPDNYDIIANDPDLKRAFADE